MKTRRRWAAGAAGVTVVLLAAPLTTTAVRSDANAGGEPASLRAQAATGPVILTAAALSGTEALPATTTTAPPPPPPTEHCPVGGPTEFVDSWGNARGGGRRHEGVDMLAAHGTPVVAPVAGTVEHRSDGVGGMSYHLTAADGTYYYGTHLAGYAAGGWVEAGTVIGFVGDTGNARGTPHLHFEIHPGGQLALAVNPFPTALDWCTPG